MSARQVKPGVYSVGANDWDRQEFDELVHLPDGTSYNAYFVKGAEKTALIDTVDPTMTDILLRNLAQLEIDRIDYVIANHAEQDHSGSLPQILELFPNAKIICTPKCKVMLIDLLLISEDKFMTVEDGSKLSLGDKTLEFLHTPWVHWPETMVTYLKEERILFTCDFFGSHLATADLFVKNEGKVYEDAKRYYAEIMMPFRAAIKKNLNKIKDLEVEMIAPVHGPIYDRPELILDAYADWTSDRVKNEVILPYVSMHGSTKEMVEYFTDALIQRGISVKPFNLSKTDMGKFAMALVDAASMVIASPTVLVGPHPKVVYAVYLANALRPKLKLVAIIGSYGWGGKMEDQLKGMISNLKVEMPDSVVVKGLPREEDFKELDRLADDILEKHKKLGLTEE